jgi:predicted nucleic acid-binding protein
MNVVDSSGWLEFLADGPNADFFAPSIQDTKKLIVPTLSIFEVFKRILHHRKEGEALQAIALMQQGTVVDFTSTLALEAAKVSIEEKLPLADSVMLATSRAYGATLWTQDSDFESISGVKYVKKV